jgi:hypothetical protein
VCARESWRHREIERERARERESKREREKEREQGREREMERERDGQRARERLCLRTCRSAAHVPSEQEVEFVRPLAVHHVPCEEGESKNALEKGIETFLAHGRSTKIVSMIRWIRTSRLSIKISLLLSPAQQSMN